MSKVVVEYGPPGANGVTSIMGVGSDGIIENGFTKDPYKLAGLAFLGAWALGAFMKNDDLKKVGFGGGTAVFLMSLFKKDPPASVAMPIEK